MKFSNVWTEIAVTAVPTAFGMALVGLAFDIDYTDVMISYAVFMAVTVAVRLIQAHRMHRN
ncbi:hypothetical protein HCB17_25720 [Salinispora arenicola]|uniref:hypothetical protein n=1 Tax=Salinispora arenicola TaxID=168697 RepID=UPI00036C52C6|nr:hypothetical protein [Salinispora arenicola]NIL44130.1 hypothetical protein [Salinispora arenicola]NIL55637.1 hypothetical protein [Salinispora arenicola]NIL64840.1 hypothetical protein [Salinispora arenicola]